MEMERALPSVLALLHHAYSSRNFHFMTVGEWWRSCKRALLGGVFFSIASSHDLRRTCAKLCRKSGGDLEQIKFLLGHSSIQTTERYLGSEQDIEIAVNDNLGL
jgi:integrase